MGYNYNKNLVSNAQKLRRNMTDEEKHLWYDFLKLLPITVNRQKNIGNYIADFFIASNQLIIEIDGAQHSMLEHEQADRMRDLYFSKLGITVLRYKNSDIHHNFNEVCNDILKHLNLTADYLRFDKQ